MISALLVMVSYSWDDAEAAELLHEELALRGVGVVHDRCSFPTGARMAISMRDAVSNCDGFLIYFTPSSLYESRPSGPRPVIDEEFIPAFDRLADENPPLLMPLVHGLGEPRTDAVERVRRATGRDISSLWMPLVLDQSTARIQSGEAAEVARLIIEALAQRHADRLETVELSVVTRGSGQIPAPLVVDATRLLGGDAPRPGDEGAWNRYVVGLLDLERALATVMSNKTIRLIPKTHLTGAFALGRIFHQAAGWKLLVAGRHGDTSYSDMDLPDDLDIRLDLGSLSGDVSVEIDLLGVNVSALTGPVLASASDPVASRLLVTRSSSDEMTPRQVAGAAASVAERIRAVVHDRRPQVVHIFCAAPADFAVLAGSRLTSLHSRIQLYERDGHQYVPSATLAA